MRKTMKDKMLKLMLVIVGLVNSLTYNRTIDPCPTVQEPELDIKSHTGNFSDKAESTSTDDDWILLPRNLSEVPTIKSYDPMNQIKDLKASESQKLVESQQSINTSEHESIKKSGTSDEDGSTAMDDWCIINKNLSGLPEIESSTLEDQEDSNDSESTSINDWTLLPENMSDVSTIESYDPEAPTKSARETDLNFDFIESTIRSRSLKYEPLHPGRLVYLLNQIFDALPLGRKNRVLPLKDTVLGIFRIHHREFLKLIGQSPIAEQVLLSMNRFKRQEIRCRHVIYYISTVFEYSKSRNLNDYKLVEILAYALTYLNAFLRMEDRKHFLYKQAFHVRNMPRYPALRTREPHLSEEQSEKLLAGFIYIPNFKKPEKQTRRANLQGNIERIKKEMHIAKSRSADFDFKLLLTSLKGIFDALPFKNEKDQECDLSKDTVLDMLKILRDEFIRIAAKSQKTQDALSSVCGFEDKLVSWKHTIDSLSSVFNTYPHRKADINNPGFAKNLMFSLIYLDATLEFYDFSFGDGPDHRN
ncbi:uncharacterized protein VICG_00385 [Vittaforma corneae ATCC 50505]|uniref:Uncharacterized protein n=1 Tax=Vittaforma corneae (strain ATCC 50505) TaxID=993615 RepID=L2GP35_VITCO|nr:uncharacterized protein VICG_00385 [Vittaforma corneae ATCC 50505]ELA42633.1 hypothetical protein VICG_00385 [Vittaforma corneae ATCC 50505]